MADLRLRRPAGLPAAGSTVARPLTSRFKQLDMYTKVADDYKVKTPTGTAGALRARACT